MSKFDSDAVDVFGSVGPKSVVKDDVLYFGDNGRVLCGADLGMSARFSYRDTSGQRIMAVTPRVKQECLAQGFEPKCEECGRVA